MLPVEVLTVLAFLCLLGVALYLVSEFYICDGERCVLFRRQLDIEGVLTGALRDGLWPVPYIGAAILTTLTLWIKGEKFTPRSFAISFLIAFIVMYLGLSFLGHHYLQPILDHIRDYIQSQ
jgi:hypothetical protein